ncbi:endonuclease/exonuclease/phosphatase family protein [Cladophialophora carrionii]|uniref:Endonuclease/exonuclease/phosphatase family protein n=1 Tax=Cladophialophora carrionii TaxID=86049 RepID=A0A1C1CCQ8_9EURO|nr:endonuclease/exonuclease/phosphatase family protein [Cladophialophora carrionii]
MGDASSPPPAGSATRDAATPEQSSSTVIPIRILTHNIRFATDTPDRAEKLWPDRFPHLSSHFKYHTRPHFAPPTTLVCMQEVLHEQLVDLHQKTFNTSSSSSTATATATNSANGNDNDNDWTYVGVGRNDGKTKGEYSPIFFRQSAWKCIHFETVWLNETGQVGKKGWDADSVRILTCAVLESVPAASHQHHHHHHHHTSTKRVLAMNTHLDNEGEISRRESAKVILAVASRLRARFSPGFTFLCGDLNSHPDGDAYQILNAPGSGFVDARRLIPDNEDGKIYAFGNDLTFTGFPEDPAATGAERIDFIHLGVPQDMSLEAQAQAQSHVQAQGLDAHDTLRDMVQCYGVLPNRFDDRVWLSDHRGVVVDVLVRLL